jgi:rhodanese-related sulfurtransferase
MEAVDYFGEKLKFEIDPPGIEELMKSGDKDYIIVDTRGRNAFREGHIPTAISMPIEELRDKFAELPKDKKIILYCYNITCLRAPKAALFLARNGYDNIVELIGGFEEWSKRGHKVEPGQ